MSLTGIANVTGVSSSGTVSVGVCNRLSMSSAVLQNFIDGTATPGIGRLLGVKLETAQELRDLITKDAAATLLLGMLIGKGRN